MPEFDEGGFDHLPEDELPPAHEIMPGGVPLNPPHGAHLHVDNGKLVGNIGELRSHTLYAIGDQYLIHFNDGADGIQAHYQLYHKTGDAKTPLRPAKAAKLQSEQFADTLIEIIHDHGDRLSLAPEADLKAVTSYLKGINKSSKGAKAFLQLLQQPEKPSLGAEVLKHLERYQSGDLEITPIMTLHEPPLEPGAPAEPPLPAKPPEPPPIEAPIENKLKDLAKAEEETAAHSGGKTKWIVGSIAVITAGIGAYIFTEKKKHSEQAKERREQVKTAGLS